MSVSKNSGQVHGNFLFNYITHLADFTVSAEGLDGNMISADRLDKMSKLSGRYLGVSGNMPYNFLRPKEVVKVTDNQDHLFQTYSVISDLGDLDSEDFFIYEAPLDNSQPGSCGGSTLCKDYGPCSSMSDSIAQTRRAEIARCFSLPPVCLPDYFRNARAMNAYINNTTTDMGGPNIFLNTWTGVFLSMPYHWLNTIQRTILYRNSIKIVVTTENIKYIGDTAIPFFEAPGANADGTLRSQSFPSIQQIRAESNRPNIGIGGLNFSDLLDSYEELMLETFRADPSYIPLGNQEGGEEICFWMNKKTARQIAKQTTDHGLRDQVDYLAYFAKMENKGMAGKVIQDLWNAYDESGKGYQIKIDDCLPNITVDDDAVGQIRPVQKTGKITENKYGGTSRAITKEWKQANYFNVMATPKVPMSIHPYEIYDARLNDGGMSDALGVQNFSQLLNSGKSLAYKDISYPEVHLNVEFGTKSDFFEYDEDPRTGKTRNNRGVVDHMQFSLTMSEVVRHLCFPSFLFIFRGDKPEPTVPVNPCPEGELTPGTSTPQLTAIDCCILEATKQIKLVYDGDYATVAGLAPAADVMFKVKDNRAFGTISSITNLANGDQEILVDVPDYEEGTQDYYCCVGKKELCVIPGAGTVTEQNILLVSPIANDGTFTVTFKDPISPITSGTAANLTLKEGVVVPVTFTADSNGVTASLQLTDVVATPPEKIDLECIVSLSV